MKFKSRKIDIFQKGLNQCFGPKRPFFQLFFWGGENIGQENVFCDNLERKSPFYPKKTRRSKSRKIDNFPSGLTHGFGPKMAIFPTFFFRQ